ncbi:hypothetical protein D3C72_766280 [compost metagenome]
MRFDKLCRRQRIVKGAGKRELIKIISHHLYAIPSYWFVVNNYIIHKGNSRLTMYWLVWFVD